MNAATFTTQCCGIRIAREKNCEVSMLNAAAFSHQCRGIRRKTQKNKGPAKARQGDEKANQDEGMDGGDE